MDVSPSGGGIIEVDQTAPSSYPDISTFKDGTSVRLEAVPASGYHFSSWSRDLSGATNPTTIVIDCNKKITANFSQLMHTLTIQASGSGSTEPTVGTHEYHEYIEVTMVDITATPNSGWQFDSWTGDVADAGSVTTTVTLDSDKTIAANFSQLMHTLTIQASGSGSTKPTVGTHEYIEVTIVDITATPNSGWQFDSWTGDVADAGSVTTTVTLGSDKTVAANFSQLRPGGPSWWLIGGIITGVIIAGAVIWLAFRGRRA